MEAVRNAIAKNDLKWLEKLLVHKTPEFCGKALCLVVGKAIKDTLKANESVDIIKANENNTIQFVKLLVTHGADVNLSMQNCGYYRGNVFSYACRYLSEPIVQLMIGRATVSFKNDSALNLINLALESHSDKKINFVVDLIVDQMDADEANNVNKFIVLELALKSPTMKKGTIYRLLQLGHGLNGIDRSGHTFLNYSVSNGNFKIVKLLIENGADVNLCSRFERFSVRSPFQIGQMCETRRPKFVRTSSDRGVVAFAESIYKTPLFYAISSGNEKIAELLLERGADISLKEDGLSALQVAVNGGCVGVCELFAKHVMLLKSQNSNVSELKLRNSEKDKKLGAFQNQCLVEIGLLKSEEFHHSSVSYYDILITKDIDQLAAFARNENIVKIVKSADFMDKFPIYWSTVVQQLKRGFGRNRDFELVKALFNYLSTRETDKLPRLPFTFICDLFTFLEVKDVTKLRILKSPPQN